MISYLDKTIGHLKCHLRRYFKVHLVLMPYRVVIQPSVLQAWVRDLRRNGFAPSFTRFSLLINCLQQIICALHLPKVFALFIRNELETLNNFLFNIAEKSCHFSIVQVHFIFYSLNFIILF